MTAASRSWVCDVIAAGATRAVKRQNSEMRNIRGIKTQLPSKVSVGFWTENRNEFAFRRLSDCDYLVLASAERCNK